MSEQSCVCTVKEEQSTLNEFASKSEIKSDGVMMLMCSIWSVALA